ncbi:MAG: ATP-binding protein [Candidatus Paceibacterota bacterium]
MEDKAKRYVITGGPCCGKTTTIGLLKKIGFPVLNETAREVLNENKRRKNPRNFLEMEIEIFERQLEKEKSAKDSKIFMDRSALDALAYSKLMLEKIPEQFLNHDFSGKYDLIFLLEMLPFEKDSVRVEKDGKEAQKIHEEICSAYLNRGYKPIIVPLLDKKERVDFILNQIKKYENGNRNRS